MSGAASIFTGVGSGFFGVMIQSANRVTVQGVTSNTSGGSALYALSSYNIKVYNNDFSNFCYLGAYGRGIACQEGISIVSVDTFDVSGNLVHDARQTGSSVQPGGGRVMACLKDKQSELSPACQAALPVMERCAQEVKSACGAAGKRGMRECLRSQSDKISPECRSLAPQR